jgi:hypothetical protein
MAILLACISIQEELEYNFSDYANLMPDLEAVVTMKDVQQTAMIVKSMDKQWSAKTLIRKVRLLTLMCIAIARTFGRIPGIPD